MPDESFFVPLLARRHGKSAERAAFLDDVARIPTIRDWGLTAEDVAPYLGSHTPTGKAIAAIFEAYAAKVGKPRWGDKTPMYMRHLDLLEDLFPDAQYVHLIRDGRDAALSFLEMPEGTFTRTWAHPATPAQFACLWRKEVEAARALGRAVGSDRYLEVRYEALVADPAAAIGAICDVGGDSLRAGDARVRGRGGRLGEAAPAAAPDAAHEGVRSWREQMSARRRGGLRGDRRRPARRARLRGHRGFAAALGARADRAGVVRRQARGVERVGRARCSAHRFGGVGTLDLSREAGTSRPCTAIRRPFSER